MRSPEQRGFTFLELMLVIGLLALIGGLFLPALPRALPFEIRAAGRVLAADLQYAQQRAIASGHAHVWVLDLDAQSFRLEYRREPEPALEPPSRAGKIDLRPPQEPLEQVPVESKVGEWRTLDQSVEIVSVISGERSSEDGVAEITFAPDGAADPAEIWLQDDAGRQLVLRLSPFTGEVRIDEEPEENRG